MCRIGAEEMDFFGKKAQFVKGIFESAALGMRFDFNIKLGRHKTAFQKVAFKFGEIDAVGGKSSQSFIKRGRYIAGFENKGSDEFVFSMLLRQWLARHD